MCIRDRVPGAAGAAARDGGTALLLESPVVVVARPAHRGGGLEQQRGVEHLGRLQVGCEADQGGEADVGGPDGLAAVGGRDRVEQQRLGLLVRALDADPDRRRAAGLPARRTVRAVEEGLVDAVPRHQLLCLGGQRLRLLGVVGRLGLGEQSADPAEGAGRGGAVRTAPAGPAAG